MLAVISIGFVATAPLYAEKPILELAPSSAWTVNYDTERCTMGREFGEGDQKVLAIFDSYAPGEEFKFSLAGKPLKINDQDGEAVL
jgi:hypothetical protein